MLKKIQVRNVAITMHDYGKALSFDYSTMNGWEPCLEWLTDNLSLKDISDSNLADSEELTGAEVAEIRAQLDRHLSALLDYRQSAIELPFEFVRMCRRDGVSEAQVISQFMADLCGTGKSRWSDQAEIAQAYYKRCGYAGWDATTELDGGIGFSKLSFSLRVDFLYGHGADTHLDLPMEFAHLCHRDNVQPVHVIKAFIADLCGLPYSSGSDERLFAQKYYEWRGYTNLKIVPERLRKIGNEMIQHLGIERSRPKKAV